jgi:hypothetical protein
MANLCSREEMLLANMDIFSVLIPPISIILLLIYITAIENRF